MNLRLIIIITVLSGFVLAVGLTIGQTLAVIQTRQQHEDEAIRCMLDQRCLQSVRARQHLRPTVIVPRVYT